MIESSRNRVQRLLAAVGTWFKTVGEALGHLWRRSLQLRVVVSTLTLSLIVITILGVVLTSQITDRLLDAKINAAVEEMGRARNTVQTQLTGVHDSGTQSIRLQDALRTLSSGTSSQAAGSAGSYEPALAVLGDGQQELTAGPINDVPAELRRFVQQNQVSYQFATVSDPEGYAGPALIIGSPSLEVPTLEVYLIFPLTNEHRSRDLMSGTMLIGGVVLLVLLAAITALVTRQVVLPIRSAARIASRFADGRLKERMLVRGEDDMARLAMSFNEMAESLSNQITQLEEFGNLQRRFTSDVSHELRTPLTTVRMAADLIHGSSDELDPALARSAELLVTELDRFEGLLNDLLEISRHDAGVAELQVESLDVRMCARAAISTVRHLAKETGVELVVDLPEDPLVAEVDPRRVERVLRNLLANAIDHSEGKPVLIRMRGDTEANAVSIVVRDRGVGLRAGEEKLVFNRFWRSDPSRMRRSGGTGLGLSISVEDANLHDGRLEAWGEPGQGASFRLTLPLVRGRKMGSSPLSLEPPRRTLATVEMPEPQEDSEDSETPDGAAPGGPGPDGEADAAADETGDQGSEAGNGVAGGSGASPESAVDDGIATGSGVSMATGSGVSPVSAVDDGAADGSSVSSDSLEDGGASGSSGAPSESAAAGGSGSTSELAGDNGAADGSGVSPESAADDSAAGGAAVSPGSAVDNEAAAEAGGSSESRAAVERSGSSGAEGDSRSAGAGSREATSSPPARDSDADDGEIPSDSGDVGGPPRGAPASGPDSVATGDDSSKRPVTGSGNGADSATDSVSTDSGDPKP